MSEFRFLYKGNEGIRNDIIIEAEEREAAIAIFETTYPDLRWYQTESIPVL